MRMRGSVLFVSLLLLPSRVVSLYWLRMVVCSAIGCRLSIWMCELLLRVDVDICVSIIRFVRVVVGVGVTIGVLWCVLLLVWWLSMHPHPAWLVLVGVTTLPIPPVQWSTNATLVLRCVRVTPLVLLTTSSVSVCI